jgi:hypothetical protein
MVAGAAVGAVVAAGIATGAESTVIGIATASAWLRHCRPL